MANMPKTSDRTVISDPIVLSLAKGRKIIDPPMKRRTWENSRLFVNEDNTTTPVLVELAHYKFGPWDPKEHYPVWKDKDFCNESPDNIALIERQSYGPRKSNPYGVPAGTREYWKKYRAANQDRMREIRRAAYHRQKEERKKLKDLEEENKRLREMASGEARPTTAESLNAKLQDIIGAPNEEM